MGFCEYYDELRGFYIGATFRYKLNNYKLLKEILFSGPHVMSSTIYRSKENVPRSF
jgi:hypothetical protein